MVIQVVAPPLAVGIVGLVVSKATKVGQSVAVAVLAVFIILQLRGKYPGHHVSTFTLKTSYSKKSNPCARRDPCISVGRQVHGTTGTDRTPAIAEG